MNAKRLLGNLAVFLLSAFIIVYIVIQLVSNLTVEVEFEFAEKTTLSETIEKEAYLVRNETVLHSGADGIVTYFVKESEKVAANEIIANVYHSSEAVTIQNRIREIDSKLDILQKSAVDTGYLTSDVSKINSKIYNSLVQMKLALANHRVSLTSQYKEELLVNFNKRQLITNNKKSFSDRIEELQAEKASLTDDLQNPLSSVVTEKAGYFSTLLDGYESVFTVPRIQSLTVDSFHEMLQEPPKDYGQDAIGKIITDFDWYTLSEMSKEEASLFTVGKSYSLVFLGATRDTIQATLHRVISQTDTDRVVLVFLIEEIPTDFDYTRHQNIRISYREYTGLSVPKGALRIVNGTEGVYVLSGNQVEFKKTEIIHTGESLYICTPADWQHREFLALHDRIIVSGKDLYVGKIVD